MPLQSEDISAVWNLGTLYHAGRRFEEWRSAPFCAMQESLDHSVLYFLYDPKQDAGARATNRPSPPCPSLVAFDIEDRCFTRVLALGYVQGAPRQLLALRTPASSGGSAFLLVCERTRGCVTMRKTLSLGGEHAELHLYRIELSPSGKAVTAVQPLLSRPITTVGGCIVRVRDDAPEAVILTGPQLLVYRVDVLATNATRPHAFHIIPEAEMRCFYDAFMTMRGVMALLMKRPDGTLDCSRVCALSLVTGKMSYHECVPADPSTGMPATPRRKPAIDIRHSWHVLLAGGQMEASLEEFGPEDGIGGYGNGNNMVRREDGEVPYDGRRSGATVGDGERCDYRLQMNQRSPFCDPAPNAISYLVDDEEDTVCWLTDYWVLDLYTFEWTRLPGAMPLALREPQLTTGVSGRMFLWGRCTEPAECMPLGEHIRIINVVGFVTEAAGKKSKNRRNTAKKPLQICPTDTMLFGRKSTKNVMSYPRQGPLPPNFSYPLPAKLENEKDKCSIL